MFKQSLKPYEKYNPVNYEYVRQLPEGWELLPNLALFEERVSKGHTDEELLSVTIGKGIIRQTENEIRKDSSNEDKSNYKLVKEGDIAYNKMRMWQGSIGYSQYRGIVSHAYIVLKPKTITNSEYYHYLLRTGFYTNYSKRFSYGIVDDQLSLRYKDFKRMYSIVPPLETQNRIVEYLNRKTEQANAFIEKQTRLVELLKEQKKAIINQAVTKGLNPDAPMKESGIEWLGEIPAHWEVRKLKYVLKLSRGVDLSSNQFRQGNYPVMGSNGVIGFHNKYNCLGPCVTVGRSGSVGEVNYVENNFWAHNTALFLQHSYGNDILFLYYLLLSLDLKSLAAGSAVGTLNRNYIHQMFVSYPNLLEQKKIVNHIKSKYLKIDQTIEKAEKEITLVKEYLQSLIYHVVTGRLKIT